MSIAPFPKLESDERHRVPAPRFIVTGHPTLNEASLERASGWEFRIIPRERARSSERYCEQAPHFERASARVRNHSFPKIGRAARVIQSKIGKGLRDARKRPQPRVCRSACSVPFGFCGLAMLPAAGQIKHRWPIDEDYFIYGEVLDILSRPHRHRVGREERAVGRDGDTIFGAPSTASRRASGGRGGRRARNAIEFLQNLGLPSPTTRRALGGTGAPSGGRWRIIYCEFLEYFVAPSSPRRASNGRVPPLGARWRDFLLDTFGIASGSGDV
ncbi:hypothetical protein B0H10DRAFT_2197476 [Mycena sp. CBHHK59/15]|nr:hypothetical protein B0H10DRAFT_2200724 [Mycena sp. CBHHK59/15]KAJ6591407.1 hypothetical protein B0H10DRAFT_2197476 [Mycena sp. CBHHK59/15]